MPFSSTCRRASTSSTGVGSGRISMSGCPARTKLPSSTKMARTTPDTLDLTPTSTSGSMVPVASARSTRSPRVTSTAGGPSSADESPAKARAASTLTLTTATAASVDRTTLVRRFMVRAPCMGAGGTGDKGRTNGRAPAPGGRA